MTTADQRARFMALALSLGRRGMGQTWPNPSVGCIIVKDGRIVGRGWTQPGGRPHAEIGALSEAGALADGADVFVTLEPCAHHGITPPCCDALIAAGVRSVAIAAGDPDVRTNGAGVDRLKNSGIQVVEGVLQDRANLDHAGFFQRVQSGRPLVTLKLATTLDGRIATASGQSQWITGPAARRKVHQLRSVHDAVLVGGGTARIDDPHLTVRGMGNVRQPVRIAVSRHLNLPWPSNLTSSTADGPVWLVHGEEANPDPKWSEAGCQLLAVSGEGNQISASALLRRLGDEGLTRVFCEGGGTLAASLLQGDLVDELVTFTAGMAMGAEGQPGIGALGVAELAEAQRFQMVEVNAIGDDVMTKWRRAG